MNKLYARAIKKHSSLIKDTHDRIWSHPETGYREFATSEYMQNTFEKLGYKLIRAENIPGFYTVLDTGKPGPEVLILCELDALICPEHNCADTYTGAVHCCGHSAQCAALVGIAAALKEPGVLDNLCGRIRLCAVPAEELIEVEYRKELVANGTIRYMGGKTEFLYRGYFDGVDIAFMVHTSTEKSFSTTPGSVGCIAKRITYKGISSHAGSSPWNGCNALYAANLGLSAINAIRETFKEPDIIRVHPIITSGGSSVNAIPDKVVLESHVRGSSFDSIRDANNRINRALIGAALSLGANINIEDTPGYAPLGNDEEMIRIAEDAAKAIPGAEFVKHDNIISACTDMGDLSGIMPVVAASIPGASGSLHGSDFEISDFETACVSSAQWQLYMLALLLENNGERAKKIIAKYKPLFKSKTEYFKYLDGFIHSKDRIVYTKDGAEVTI